MNQLSELHFSGTLVIGNGFDLNIGLRSSFDSFFQSRVLNANHGLKNKENLLYLLLYFAFYDDTDGKRFIPRFYKGDPLWMDVETFIGLIAKGNTTTDYPITQALFSIYCAKDNGDVHLASEPQREQLHNLLRAKRKKFGQRNIDVIDDIFYDDLLEFKKDFCDYLKSEIARNRFYHMKARRLLAKLHANKDQHSFFKRIISFNYTRPDNGFSELEGFYPDYLFANVHGRLDSNNIALGHESRDENGVVKPLSKGWQKLNASCSLTSGAHVFDERDPFSFYGHSLGEQDYPQLFAILDTEFLNADTLPRLVFYYSNYLRSVEANEKNRDRYAMAVSRFVNAYGKYRFGFSNNELFYKLKDSGKLLTVSLPTYSAVFMRDDEMQSDNLPVGHLDYVVVIDEKAKAAKVSLDLIASGENNVRIIPIEGDMPSFVRNLCEELNLSMMFCPKDLAELIQTSMDGLEIKVID